MGQPKLGFIVEPDTKFRFRYASETNSHGGVLGKQDDNSQTNRKVYPTVKLENYLRKQKVYVRVSLCTKDHEPHILPLAGKHARADGKSYEDLNEDHYASFNNLIIRNLKKDEALRLLKEREIQKPGNTLLDKKLENKIKEKSKRILTSAVLCFEAFYHGKPDQPICAPLYSEPIIHHASSLKIVRISRWTGSWKGSEDVILLCDKVKKGEIKVLFSEQGENGKVWEAEGKFSPADVHHQVAIAFKTPCYRRNADQTVSLCLGQNSEQSDPVEFRYLPDEDGDAMNSVKKRKRNQEMLNVVDGLLSSPDINELIADDGLIQNNTSDSDVNGSFYSNSSLDSNICEMNGNMFETVDLKAFESLMKHLEDDSPLPFDSDSTVWNFGEYETDFAIASNTTKIKLPDDKMKSRDRERFGEIEGQMAKCHPMKEEQKVCKKEKMKQLALLLSSRDELNNTLLHLAVMKSKDIEHLLEMMSDSSCYIVDVYNKNKKNALHLATELNDSKSVDLLCFYGANPQNPDGDGNNCFHIAVQNDSLPCLRALFANSASGVNDFNYEGLTPLHLSVSKEQQTSISHDILKLLLKTADVNVKDKKSGQTPLHLAAVQKKDLISVLLQQPGIDVDIQDFGGNTPLHFACRANNYAAVKLLLEAEADPQICNFGEPFSSSSEDVNVGLSPVDVSTDQNIIELLKSKIGQSCGFCKTLCKSPTSESSITNEPGLSPGYLCDLLDQHLNKRDWETIALCLGFESIVTIFLDDSPARSILNHLKNEYGEDYFDVLINALESAGLQQTLKLVKEQKS